MPTKLTLDLSQPGAEPVEVELVGEELAAHDALMAADARRAGTTSFEASEDAERLRVITERARTDPAYAALADIVLRGKP